MSDDRIELARLLIDSAERLAAAGVRVFEVGDGPTRVRVEIEPASSASLIRQTFRAMLRESAPDHPAAQAAQDDPERADDDSQPRPDEEDAKPAGRNLDLAHLP